MCFREHFEKLPETHLLKVLPVGTSVPMVKQAYTGGWVDTQVKVPTRIEKQVYTRAHTHTYTDASVRNPQCCAFLPEQIEELQVSLGETRWKGGIRVRKSVESFCECSVIEYKVPFPKRKKNLYR